MPDKIFVLTESIDKGIMRSWHFQVANKCEMAEFIIANLDRYDTMFKGRFWSSGLAGWQRREQHTPTTLLKAIDNSHVEGDSVSRFEIHEIDMSKNGAEAEDVTRTNNEELSLLMKTNAPYRFETDDALLKEAGVDYGKAADTTKKSLAFQDFDLTDLEKMFGLRQLRHIPLLTEWLNFEHALSDYERRYLSDLRDELIDTVDGWNEEELKMHFIGPMFSFVNFTTEHFNIFANRYISGAVGEHDLGGFPDSMIASGRRKPELPYFCFQEYKKEKDPDGDPAGQALAAMMLAQELNGGKRPIYGCYVVGRNWFFMVLQGKTYCISQNYSATKDEIFDIFRILKGLKQRIITIASES